MSGGKKFAGPSQAETNLISLGNQQIRQGRAIEQPNLLHLKEVALLSDSDRANILAKTKATGAADTTAALRQGLAAGMRRGATGGAATVGVDDVAAAVGAGNASRMVESSNNLDQVDLTSRGAVVQQALTGAGEALTGLRAGAVGVGSAELDRVKNRNLKSEQDASTFTNLALTGLKGAQMLGARAVDSGATKGLGAFFARNGLVDDNYLASLQRRGMNKIDWGNVKFDPIDTTSLSLAKRSMGGSPFFWSGSK